MAAKENKIINWEKLFNQESTPIINIEDYKNCQILIKRDDLNHDVVQGNKLRKLKYNLLKAINNEYNSVLTFGGAFSNHIVATAQATKECGLNSIGVIRGDELEFKPENWSSSLVQAANAGMKLCFISRNQYRQKHHSEEVKSLISQSQSLFIPEGGSNSLAIKGASEIITELASQCKPPDCIVLACGTGGTLAGILEGIKLMNWKTKIFGIPVLKAGDSIHDKIKELSLHCDSVDWKLCENYHFGGYAKSNKALMTFSQSFSNCYKIPLDKVYTSKAFYAAYDLIDKGEIKANSRVLILHTGGLQGGSF